MEARNDCGRLRVVVVAATIPGRRQGRPWPYEDGSTSEGWGALPRFYGKQQTHMKAPPLLTGLSEFGRRSTAYLRVAHIYMLISIPTDTSTIFGAFHAIWLSLFPDEP